MSNLIETKELEVDFLPWLSGVLQVIYQQERGNKTATVSVPCGDCTLCCSDNRVELTEEEAVNPKLKVVEDISNFPDIVKVLARDRNGKCFHLGPIGCKVFEDRPSICRAFDCRKRIVANMADVFTLAMEEQWQMDRWYTEENELFINAIQSAALMYQQAEPAAGISKITAYAITHFQHYLGPVYLQMKARKSGG